MIGGRIPALRKYTLRSGSVLMRLGRNKFGMLRLRSGYVNKRALLTASLLTLCGWAVKASETSYTLKVMAVNRTAGRIEAKFMVVPEDMRLVCYGKVENIYETDYIKVEYKDGHVFIKGAECTSVMWLH
jgi:hypothetical protein